MHAYVNDVEAAQQEWPLTLNWLANYKGTQIGNNTYDTNCDYSFDGDIDEVTIATTR